MSETPSNFGLGALALIPIVCCLGIPLIVAAGVSLVVAAWVGGIALAAVVFAAVLFIVTRRKRS